MYTPHLLRLYFYFQGLELNGLRVKWVLYCEDEIKNSAEVKETRL